MGTFTGTQNGDYIRSDYVSLGVVADPAGTRPGAGADTIYGNGGDDYIESSDGSDTIYGGAGNDTVYGGNGDDLIDDYNAASYGAGNDTFYGGFGNDIIYGYQGDDALYGDDGADSIYGEDGDDTLDGGVGADFMSGGSGYDTYYADNAGDTIQEVSGDDWDTVYASASFILPAYTEVLHLGGRDPINGTGNSQENSIYGNESANNISGLGGRDYLYGYEGVDSLDGGDGDDYLEGGDGADAMTGGNGNDRLVGGGGADVMTGGAGDDTFEVDSAQDKIVETPNGGIDTVYSYVDGLVLGDGLENLVLRRYNYWYDYIATTGTGNALSNSISGNGLDNQLFGLGGNDYINGSWGDDTMVGGAGNDTFEVESTGDKAIEAANGGIDTIYTYIDGLILGDNFENLRLAQYDYFDQEPRIGTGNAQANGIYGNDYDNQLFGMGGVDTLFGYGGSDTLNGGVGADSMNGGLGDDFYFADNSADKAIEAAGQGTDTVYSTATFTLGTDVEKLYLTGTANVNGTGNALANLIAGNSYVNTLHGLGGADTFQSGNGADSVIGGAGNDVFQFLTVVGSTPAARDTLQAGDGAVAFEKPGAQLGDRIDVSAFDANTGAAGTQDFVFGTSHAAGRLWAVDSGTTTLIRGNTDSDATVEFEVAIQDGAIRASAYTGADFLV